MLLNYSSKADLFESAAELCWKVLLISNENHTSSLFLSLSVHLS